MEPAPQIEQLQDYQAPQPLNTKRIRISLKLKIILVFLIIILLGGFFTFLKFQYRGYRAGSIKFNQNEDTQKDISNEPDFTKKLEFKDEKRKFSLQYPEVAQIDNSGPLTIWYTGNKQGVKFNIDNDLRDGFIFRVSVIQNIINQDSRIAAEQQLQSYRQTCGEFYSTSQIMAKELDTIPGYSFNITNCPVDAQEVFVLYNNSIYRITMAYKGDIGYKERYKQMAEDILSGLTFLDKPQTPDAPKLITFTDERWGVSFVHPRFDYNCCTISGPLYGKPELIVAIGDPGMYQNSNGRSFDGMAVYIDRNATLMSFENYLDVQKKSLIENYKIVKGEEPNPSEQEIKVGEVNGVLLKGYAWWGDMIYLQIPGSESFMNIAKVESSQGSFEKTFSEILKTFLFNQK